MTGLRPADHIRRVTPSTADGVPASADSAFADVDSLVRRIVAHPERRRAGSSLTARPGVSQSRSTCMSGTQVPASGPAVTCPAGAPSIQAVRSIVVSTAFVNLACSVATTVPDRS
jgi:hypothetical protein